VFYKQTCEQKEDVTVLQGYAALWTIRFAGWVAVPAILQPSNDNTTSITWIRAITDLFSASKVVNPDHIPTMKRSDILLETFDHTCSHLVGVTLYIYKGNPLFSIIQTTVGTFWSLPTSSETFFCIYSVGSGIGAANISANH
jgi:hypothetical protein